MEFACVEHLNNNISCLDTGDSRVFARIEAYSCKAAHDDKRLQRHLEQKYNTHQLANAESKVPAADSSVMMMDSPPTTLSSPHFMHNPTGSPGAVSVKTFCYLIGTLNQVYPDYDFSDVHPDAFVRISMADATAGLRGILHEVPNKEQVLAEIFQVLEEVVEIGDNGPASAPRNSLGKNDGQSNGLAPVPPISIYQFNPGIAQIPLLTFRIERGT